MTVIHRKSRKRIREESVVFCARTKAQQELDGALMAWAFLTGKTHFYRKKCSCAECTLRRAYAKVQRLKCKGEG